MRIWKRIAAIVLACALCIGVLAGCGGSGASGSSGTASGDAIRIGFVNEANAVVFDFLRMQALQEAVDASGGRYTMECSDANGDIQKQIDQAKTFIAEGVDILMLVPCDSEGIVPAIEEANRAGIPVICFGIEAASGDFVYVGSDNYEAGYMQGEYMSGILPDHAAIMYLLGTQGLLHTTDRLEGFRAAVDAAGRTDIMIQQIQGAGYLKDEALDVVDTWVQSYADGNGGVTFDAIVAQNDQMALGAVESLKKAKIISAGADDNIIITGIDGTDEGLEAVSQGLMAQTVLQDAPGQAEAGLEAIEKILAGEEIEGGQVIVPFRNVTAENISDYIS